MDQNSVAQVEATLLRIPEIRAARIVLDDVGKPVEVHIVASGDKPPKQLVRDIQTVSLANFGLDLDHRIVSVVQFPNGGPPADAPPAARASISEISTETRGATSKVKVVLEKDGVSSSGEATGITSGESLQRIAALATLDAVKGLLTNGTWIGFDTVCVQRVGSHDVALATITLSGAPGGALNLAGSAVVTAQQTDAVARAVLDAVNRRLWRA